MHKLLKMEKKIDIQGLYTFFYFEHSKDFHYIGEKHDFWELVYVDSGEIYAVSDNDGFVLSQGDLIFHKPMEFHGMTAVKEKPHNVLVATFETQSPAMNFFVKKIFTLNSNQKKMLSFFLEKMKNSIGINFYIKQDNEIKLSAEQALEYQMGIDYLECFLLELMRESESAKRIEKISSLAKKNVENAFADAIKEYLEENVYSTLTLDNVCRRFNMSKSYICQIFKNETGTSVIDYYISLKMKEAKLLIREGKYNFTQISEKLGYNSLHHFTRIFKAKEKMSPSLYEKSIK